MTVEIKQPSIILFRVREREDAGERDWCERAWWRATHETSPAVTGVLTRLPLQTEAFQTGHIFAGIYANTHARSPIMSVLALTEYRGWERGSGTSINVTVWAVRYNRYPKIPHYTPLKDGLNGVGLLRKELPLSHVQTHTRFKEAGQQMIKGITRKWSLAHLRLSNTAARVKIMLLSLQSFPEVSNPVWTPQREADARRGVRGSGVNLSAPLPLSHTV